MKSVCAGHFLVGLIFLDRYVAFLGVLDVKRGDLAVFYVNRNGVFPFLVEHVVTVGFDFLAKKLFPVLMVMFVLLCGERTIDNRENAEDGDKGSEKGELIQAAQAFVLCIAGGCTEFVVLSSKLFSSEDDGL